MFQDKISQQFIKGMENGRKILLIGSGLMAESVAKHLLKRPENKIHIASDIVQQAQKLAKNLGEDKCTFGPVNATSRQSLLPLIQDSDIVISYIPAFLHIHVAKVCLQAGKHLVTASYVSPQMKALDEEAKSKNLIFLNELGLDPGIDHLATAKIIDQVYSSGGKIIQYESWCGGLPSPDSCDNPLGYKFTWSPIGAFRALNNKAIFIENNKQIQIQAADLLYYGKQIQVNQALTLQGYPNRNSVAYKQIYNLKDAHKVLRGTLRYKGFCNIINALKALGITAQVPVQGKHWKEYIQLILKDEEGDTLENKIKSRCFNKVKHYQNLGQQEKNKKFNSVLKALKFFQFLSQSSKFANESGTSLDNLVKLLEPKLALKEGQADLIAMQHRFICQDKNGKKLITSSLIQIGEKNGASAMSKTVGTPTAIGAQLILDGKISERGVLIPIFKDIYIPVLQELAKAGIKLFDAEQEL